MKKFLIIIFIIALCFPIIAQQGIQYKVDYIDFNFDMDSTTATQFTTKYVLFDEGAKEIFFTGGNYALWVYWDSTASRIAGTDSCNLGDTDSMFISVKPFIKDPNGNFVTAENDSTFLTQNSGGIGLNFDIDKWYIFEFSIPPCSGIEFRQKRNCDVGAFNSRYICIK